MSNPDPVSAAFGALSDPTRRKILEILVHQDATVQEIAAPFSVSLPAISRHLKVLEEAQLIEREKEAQWRRCRLRPEGFQAAAGFIESYRAFWSEQFDALDQYLRKVKSKKRKKK